MSAVFDTVDHGILLEVLHNRFSVTNISLSCICSYLTDKTQSISVNGVNQNRVRFIAVSHGDLFLDQLFHSNLVHHYLFADDKQLYSATLIIDATRKRLVSCILDVRDWCASRQLQLNAGKTELVWFGSAANLRKISNNEPHFISR